MPNIKERIIETARQKALQAVEASERRAEMERRQERLDRFLELVLEHFKPLDGLRVQRLSREPYVVRVTPIPHQQSVIITYDKTRPVHRGSSDTYHYRIWITAFYSSGRLGLRSLTEPTVRFQRPEEADRLDSGMNYLRAWAVDDEQELIRLADEVVSEQLVHFVEPLEYTVNA